MRIVRLIGIICLMFLTGIIISCGGEGDGGAGGHTISGVVTFEGGGVSGVTMTLKYSKLLNGGSTMTTTTASNGNYRFNVGTSYCSISASKYGFKFGTWGPSFVDHDISNVNLTATSCLAECPVIQEAPDHYPENNFVITKSSPVINDKYAFKIWDGYYQAVFFGSTFLIDSCGGATSVDITYVIDGQSLDQMYKFTLFNPALCWAGDRPSDCLPMPKLDSSGYIIMGWRYPQVGTHTWFVKATNLYSGCTTSSEIRTLIIEP